MFANKFRSLLLIALGVFLSTSVASADIIKLQSAQSCNVIGLDSSAATAHGGVHCDTGDKGFSLTEILNGTIHLFVGNSQTPSWNVINDTGKTITSLTLYYSGQLASNANIDMQTGGGSPFKSCAETSASVVYSDPTCGTHDIAPSPYNHLPLEMVWSNGYVLSGGTFNIGTSSFAHAGADAGCIDGTSDCKPMTPTPEPSGLVILGSGLAGLAGTLRRKRKL